MKRTEFGCTEKENKLVIGITGGAGSGKTTIVEGLKKHFDLEFVHCDLLAKELMKPGRINYLALLSEYGEQILSDDGNTVSTDRLTYAVTHSDGGFEKLDRITHPNVTTEVVRTIAESKKHIIIVEAALLLESGLAEMCDDVWYVYSPVSERRIRIGRSRDWSEEKIETIFQNQQSETCFRENCTFSIQNVNDPECAVLQGVQRILELDGRK